MGRDGSLDILDLATRIVDGPSELASRAMPSGHGFGRDVRRLADRLHDPAGLAASEVVAALTRLGVDGESAQQWLAQAITRHPQLIDSWRNWESGIDREEQRVRLEVISRCDAMPVALVGMAQFCFRASVADLYQPAAIAVGRNRHRIPELAATISEYLEQRQIDPAGAVVLDGRRAPRRAILLRAADPALEDGSIPFGELLRRWPRHPADISVALLAVETMCANDARHVHVARSLLERIESLEPRHLTRSVVQRLGELMVIVDGAGEHGLVVEKWRALHERIAPTAWDEGDESIGGEVAGLLRLDELDRTVARLSEASATEVCGDRLADEDEVVRLWRVARILEWRRRDNRSRFDSLRRRVIDEFPEAASTATTTDSGLLTARGVANWMMRRAIASTVGRSADDGRFAGARSSDTADLATILDQIRDSARWRSHDRDARAMLAVLLIDLTLNGEVDREQIRAMLARADDPTARRRQHPPDPLSGILLRLLSWEGAGAETLIDTRMLHRIDDVRVLLALVPTARTTPLAASLADALEHQIRVGLRAGREGATTRLLRELSVRRPHDDLFAALMDVTRDRAYRREVVDEDRVDEAPGDEAPGDGAPDESVIDVRGLIATARREEIDGASVQEGPIDRDAPAAFAATRTAIAAYDAAVASGLEIDAALVDLLRRVGRRQHVASAGRVESAGRSESATLVDVLHAMHGVDGPLLSEGSPAWRDQTIRALQEEVDEIVARLHERVPRLLSDSWAAWTAVPEVVEAVQIDLQRLTSILDPVLPTVESRWLRRASSDLIDRLGRRSASVRRVFGARGDDDHRRVSSEPDGSIAAVATEIAALDETELRERLFRTLVEAMAHPVAAESAEAWRASERTLQAATEGDMTKFFDDPRWNAWHEVCSALWRSAVGDAMTRQDQLGAMALLVDERYAPLRSDPAGRAVLDAARSWCHARLRLGTALAIRRELLGDSRGVRRTGGMGRELVAFIAHYSTVWLAMLIGCILMLDFGDAWKSMAEIDDVRGIAITFLIGVAGTYAYLLKTLRDRDHPRPDEAPSTVWASRLARAGSFLVVCLVYTIAMTSLFWLLLSRTDEVVHGVGAIGHIIVWAGFALFTGVFLGLVAGEAGES